MMNKPIWRFLTISGSLIILNVIWLVTAPLLVTIFPIMIGIWQELEIMMIRKGTLDLKRFFRTFKNSFLPALPISFLAVGLIVSLPTVLKYYSNFGATGYVVQLVVLGIFLGLLMMIPTLLQQFAGRQAGQNVTVSQLFDSFFRNIFKDLIALLLSCLLVYTVFQWFYLLMPILPLVLLTLNVWIMNFDTRRKKKVHSSL